MFNFIKSEQNKDQKGIKKSNVKGWHSKDFDLKRRITHKILLLLSYRLLNK